MIAGKRSAIHARNAVFVNYERKERGTKRKNTMITSYENSLITGFDQRYTDTTLRLQTTRLFNLAYNRGRLAHFLMRIFGKDNHLQTLASQPVSSPRSTGHIISVPISQIKGTLGRSDDFDTSFNPLHERSRSRWVSILTAMLMGSSMPAVELVKVGSDYYVQDGHHRISVAHSLGQEAIEARIVN
jgi:hypothetical protein